VGEPISAFDCAAPAFRNRTDELRLLLHHLSIYDGKDFWLVVAPPQMGKTWFLDRLGARVDRLGDQNADWTVTTVDARHEDPDVLVDSRKLLARLFARDCPSWGDGLALAKEIGIEVSRRNQRRLCLLDSAELLDARVVKELREHLDKVHDFVKEAQGEHARVVFVVASRRDDEWSGVTPRRLFRVPLTPFDPHVVTQALREAAAATRRNMSSVELAVNAANLYRYSEGLPALLARGIEQLYRDGFVGLSGIGQDPDFAKLFHSYVEDQVLSAESLYPAGTVAPAVEHDALVAAFRALMPYRILVQSHLSHDVDDEVRVAFDAAGWQNHDVWRAVRLYAPLVRPQTGPYDAIDPAVRRLLTRHFYPDPAQVAAAHRRAIGFFSGLVATNSGWEQAICVVEQLWHEAARLEVDDRDGMRPALLSYAYELARALQPSTFSGKEVARQVVGRLRDDEEFEDTVRHSPGLFHDIIDVFDRLLLDGPS
jgi:hypothetical protein